MGVEEAAVNSIMSGIENTGGVKQHNHKKKLRQRFDIIKKLGQGTFGKVQLGINKETGQEVAIKTIKKSKIESDADLIRIRREIQIMSSVQHPNIIHIYEVFENREKMVLVMEYAAGGELYDYLSERKVLPEDEARRIFRQIATACYYCHKHKICHRDLKLENILLDENNNAKIADFGLSNVFDDQRLLNTFCGSPLYASPEIVKGTPYQGPEVDCWSLGVLLYTLVYGAMPFDGSNFKRLVKQISQGDYYEPAKPSPASPLIRDMLTVSPKKRANIEQICSHWWVNETYDECCLDISEELANQTPVRLDVLLSLAPPAPQLESENLMVNIKDEVPPESVAPTRSQSVGSLMEFTSPEKRIIDLINEEKFGPKRKLESTVSTDRVNMDRRREKIIKENTVADISVHGAIQEDASQEDESMAEASPLNKSLTQTISREKEMDVEGATYQEIIEEKKEKENATLKKSAPSKIKRTLSNAAGKVLEGINEIPSQENNLDKENKSERVPQEGETSKKEAVKEKKPTITKKVLKKKVLTDKNENDKGAKPEEREKTSESVKEKEKHQVKENGTASPKQEKSSPKQDESTSKPVERRKSRIFEAAEKFQSMISPTETKSPPVEKPKKILIPDSMVAQQGVSVDGFKKEFERKASLTSLAPAKAKTTVTPKKTFIDKQKSEEEKIETPVEKETSKVVNSAQEIKKPDVKKQFTKPDPEVPKSESPKTDDSRKEKVKNAVSIISSALDNEGARKSKSRPCVIRKPPVPFGVSGRSASGNIASIGPLSPPIQNVSPKPFIRPCYENKLLTTEAKQVKEEEVQPHVDEPKTSSAEITLKSATLPRRKTTKAQIQLNYPAPKSVPQMEFRTEVAHNVAAPPQVRSEVVVPVGGPTTPTIDFRATDPQDRSSKERIIPIAFEKIGNGRETVQSPPAKPPMPRPFQTQKSNISQRSGSLSRQSTQDSDSETTTSTGEPIKKSPREYIIPIAVEGGGYVTPRAGSLEPSDTASTTSTMTNRSKTKFGRGARRLNSLLSDRDSEDESPFSALHRHSSFGKDSDTEDSKKDNFPHMHRLRRIRPKKSTLEHADSLSSGEEDDDDGFEILTAENLFSTLLSRVRDLTQRLNVDDGARPGFPNSRLLSHFDHGTFFNRMDNPLTRHSSLSRTFGRPSVSSTQSNSSFGVPWRRSVSKDLASDIQSVFNDQNSDTLTARVPRGDDQPDNTEENLNLAELDLKKLNLSEEDRLALSHLTPGLSKRIEKQLLAQLTPSEIRKLQRTLSSKTTDEVEKRPEVDRRRSVGRMSCTLPRRSAVDKEPDDVKTYGGNAAKSLLPVKYGAGKNTYKPSYDFSVRSSSIGSEPRGDCKFPYSRPKVARSVSTREPRIPRSSLQSPESSISESLSKNDDTSNSYRHNTDSYSSKYSDSSLSRPYSKYSSDSSYTRYTPSRSNQNLLSPTSPEPPKTDTKQTQPTRRISRFLRPDFFEPKEENVYIKEKKERERETQQVLKEIRDKRKSRLRSQSRSRGEMEEKRGETPSREIESKQETGIGIGEPHTKLPNLRSERESKIINEVPNNVPNQDKSVHDYVNMPAQSSLLNTTSKVLTRSANNSPDTSGAKEASGNSTDRVKSPVNSSAKALHDYVNVKVAENSTPAVKKENRISRLARPKSYPTESAEKEQNKDDKTESKVEKVDNVESKDNKIETNGKESKISKLKKGFGKKEKPTKEAKNEANKTINEEDKAHKNKLLQTIEKKLEKFRSNNVAVAKDPEEAKALLDKKTIVDSAIKRLREQSLPRNLEPCTESGFIKRAVSVEDLAVGTKPLQASRKSVTKILGLFNKKHEENDKKKEKPVKKVKVKDDKKSKGGSEEKTNSDATVSKSASNSPSNFDDNETEKVEKKERPKSLLLDKVKHFQNNYNGAKSDSLPDKSVTNEKPKSKLPLNSFRRSLNLDNLPEPPQFYKNHSSEAIEESKPDRRNLKLDFSRKPSKSSPPTIIEPVASTSGTLDADSRQNNRNSLTTTDDSSTVMSPTDDYLSCDSWSACSDFHHLNDLHSPQSYNGHGLYSGDENESVIDRIRRKSFYTRFNEKKRPRKPNVDLYGRDYGRDYGKPDYSSLDRYRSPGVSRRTSFTSYIPEERSTGPSVSSAKEYKPYVRSATALNDYVNVPGGHQNLTHSYQNVPGSHQNFLGSYQHLPGSYQTYNSRIARPSSVTRGLYSDSDSYLDDILTSAIPRRHSPYTHRTTRDRGSVSPVSEQYFTDHRPSSMMQSPTTSEPI